MTASDTSPNRPDSGLDANTILPRLDRLPVWPYPKIVLWMVGIGYFFAFFDVGNMAPVLPVVTTALSTTTETAALALSLNLVGFVVGALGLAYLSDLRGRRTGLFLAVVFVAGGSLVSGVAGDINTLIIARFIVGVGTGTAIATVTTYAAEIAPAALRGRYTALATVIGFSGGSVVPFIALVIVPNFSWGWRILLAFPLVAALTLPWILRKVPESPRWLMAQGRIEEAEAVVAAAERHAASRHSGTLPPIVPVPPEPESGQSPFRVLMGRTYRPRVLLLLVIWTLFYFANYGFTGLTITFLTKGAGFSLSWSLVFGIIISVGAVAGGLAAASIIDRFERKHLLMTVAGVFTVAAVTIALAPSVVPLVLASMTIGLCLSMFSSVGYTLSAEQFPTRGRSVALAATEGVGHLGGAIAPPVLLATFSAGGFSVPFLVIGGALICVIALLPMTRATRGRSLSQIDV
ncbi:MFS transporter [Nonomuraea sp. NPDC046570]|uniref:MFS transporter n=1 Tax=Nonomuraea sp. NPDC046570 TaxID=3155255 RepID=UPI0033D081A0